MHTTKRLIELLVDLRTRAAEAALANGSPVAAGRIRALNLVHKRQPERIPIRAELKADKE